LLLLSQRLLLLHQRNLWWLLWLLQLDSQQNPLPRPGLPGCKPLLLLLQRHSLQVLPVLLHQGCNLLLHRQLNLPVVHLWLLHKCCQLLPLRLLLLRRRRPMLRLPHRDLHWLHARQLMPRRRLLLQQGRWLIQVALLVFAQLAIHLHRKPGAASTMQSDYI
jgi:hypothetical protein